MEIVPLLFSGLSTALASLNTYVLRRQSAHLKLLNGRSAVGLHEIDKLIHEKDEALGHVYALYTLVTELHDLLTSLLTPSYRSPVRFDHAFHTATVHVDPTVDVTHEQFYLVWAKPTTPAATATTITFHATDHPDAQALVYTLTKLFAWCERKKTNQTAIHAFHAGTLHLAVDAVCRFLHGTSDTRLQVPLVQQKHIGGWWLAWEALRGDACPSLSRRDEPTNTTETRGANNAGDGATSPDETDAESDGDEVEPSETAPSAAASSSLPLPPPPPLHTLHDALHHWRRVFAPTTHPLFPTATASTRFSNTTDGYGHFAHAVVTAPPCSAPTTAPRYHHLRTPATNHNVYLVTDPVWGRRVLRDHRTTHTHYAPLVRHMHELLDAVAHAKDTFAASIPDFLPFVTRVWCTHVRSHRRRFAWRYRGVVATLSAWAHAAPRSAPRSAPCLHPPLTEPHATVHHRFQRALRTPEHRSLHTVAVQRVKQLVAPTLRRRTRTDPRPLSNAETVNIARRLMEVYAPVLFRCGCACGQAWGSTASCGELVEFHRVVGKLVRSTDAVIHDDMRFRERLMSGHRGRLRVV